MKVFQTKLEQIGSELWENIFRVENSIAEQFISGDDKRVICTVNGLVRYHAALLHDGMGGYMMLLNQARRKQLGVRAGDLLTIQLEKDTSEYGMPMSDELREVLDQDSDADILFHRLTPGKQRTLIHWADNVKNPDIRIRRALVMTAHLTARQGGIDFKELNEELKEANRAARRE